MIKLKNILSEFDFGDKLWADSAYGSSSGPYANLISLMYGKDGYEDDTREEMDLWSAVKDYLKDAEKDGVSRRRDDVKELLSLKKRFPRMLDPRTDIGVSDTIYRGMTAELDQIIKYISQATSIEQYQGQFRWLLLKGVRPTITSRSDQGFISATWKQKQAQDFGIMNQRGTRYPIVAMSPYNMVANKSIIAPSYATMLSGYDEGEFWILGDTMQSEGLLIGNPEVYGVFHRPSDPDYETSSGMLLVKALQKKGYDIEV